MVSVFNLFLQLISESETPEENFKEDSKIHCGRWRSCHNLGKLKFYDVNFESIIFKTVTVSDHEMERQTEKRVLRRQELQELRKLQIEEQRQMSVLNMKLTSQLDQLINRQEKENSVSKTYFSRQILPLRKVYM